MNKLETNALRIAELMGWISNDEGAENTFVQVYSSYNGLMPIVFECNVGFNVFQIQFDSKQVRFLRNNYQIEFDHGDGGIYYDSQDDEPLEFLFIEKIQKAVIKYLELKNDE